MLIIVGENADNFEELRTDLMDEHDPQSALECELVERLAGILWRLRRVPFFEAAILDAHHVDADDWNYQNKYRASEEIEEEEDEEESDWNASVRFGKALINDATENDALGKLARHETTLMNALKTTLKMLLVLQRNRSGGTGDAMMLEATSLTTN